GDPFRKAVGGLLDDAVLAALHHGHVDPDSARCESVLGAAPSHVDCARARDERFRRDATVVDASSAEQLALDESGLQALLVQSRSKRRARLARPDDYRVETLAHSDLRFSTLRHF